jgi:hypothetical protein
MTRALAIALLLVLASPPAARAYEFTCDQVRWAIGTFPKSAIRAYARLASPQDLARARRCLGHSRRRAQVTP